MQMVIFTESFILFIDIGQQLMSHLFSHMILKVVHALNDQLYQITLFIQMHFQFQIMHIRRMLRMDGKIIYLFMSHV